MSIRVACLADTVRTARVAASLLDGRLPGATLVPHSLSSFLAARNPPRRVVLCPGGASIAADVAFLRRVAARLLWPAPPARLAEAIGGIRSGDEGLDEAGAARRRAAGRRGPALLLEGPVDPARARAAIAGSRTREWIVESAAMVRLTPRVLALLEREGVRWSALAPVDVEALYATPALSRAARTWRRLLPPRTPVWIRRERRARRRR